MSRSIRHTPIIGNAGGESDKPGKAQANRKLRVHTRLAIIACTDFEGLLVPVLREVSNVWDFPKDGKHYMKNRKASWYRKYMRK